MLLKKNIPIGYVFGKVKIELMLILVYSLAIAVIHEWFLEVPISIPLAVPAVLGTVISLLLGFRSNQAYDRWWEARQVWGAIVNDSRTFARQVISFTSNLYEDEAIYKFRQSVIKRQIAWCFGLEQLLRRKPSTLGLDKWLSKKDMEGIM